MQGDTSFHFETEESWIGKIILRLLILINLPLERDLLALNKALYNVWHQEKDENKNNAVKMY